MGHGINLFKKRPCSVAKLCPQARLTYRKRVALNDHYSTPLISIIIPVYNTADYLPHCLDSVVAQTYEQTEVILVDDGSDDGSERICDEYAGKHGNIRVIHQENRGLSAARNAGIDEACGTYISFVDSDDCIRSDMISKELELAMKYSTPLVIGSHIKVSGNMPAITVASSPEYRTMIYDNKELLEAMLSRRLSMYAHGKLYAKNLFDNIRFPEGKLFEDVPVLWRIIRETDRAVYVDEPFYYYRQRPDSIVNMAFTPRRMDQLTAAEDIYRELTDTTASANTRYNGKGITNINSLAHVAATRCFFSAIDNYSLVTNDYRNEQRLLEEAIRKYRGYALTDSKAPLSLRLMAATSYMSVRLAGKVGRIYKKLKTRAYR